MYIFLHTPKSQFTISRQIVQSTIVVSGVLCEGISSVQKKKEFNIFSSFELKFFISVFGNNPIVIANIFLDEHNDHRISCDSNSQYNSGRDKYQERDECAIIIT